MVCPNHGTGTSKPYNRPIHIDIDLRERICLMFNYQ